MLKFNVSILNRLEIMGFLLIQSKYIIFKGNPKLWRHIKLNPTNIALLLKETTQKYQKLTD